jgi:hypothetical protein
MKNFIIEFWYFIIGFFKFLFNIWKFRKILWRYRGYDYTDTLCLLQHSLKDLHNSIFIGYEEDDSKNKKLQKIERTIEILNNIIEDNYRKISLEKLGYEEPELKYTFVKIDNNRTELKFTNTKEENKIFSELLQMQQQLSRLEWEELWKILNGNRQYFKDVEEYFELFDGSGLDTWW